MDRNLRNPIRAIFEVNSLAEASVVGMTDLWEPGLECVDARGDERHRSSPFGLVFFGTNRGSLPKEPLYKAF
jgi:hypothetical protein